LSKLDHLVVQIDGPPISNDPVVIDGAKGR
jgi:hypothetical protein